MNDGNLLVFGCAVTFIALAGAYVYLRERYLGGPIEGEARPAKAAQSKRRRAA